MISEVELALEEGAKLFRVGTIEGVGFPDLDPTRKVRFDYIIDSISHRSRTDGLGVSGRWYSTWGSAWPSRRVGGKLWQIG